MYAKKILLAVTDTLVLLVGAGVAYANSGPDEGVGTCHGSIDAPG